MDVPCGARHASARRRSESWTTEAGARAADADSVEEATRSNSQGLEGMTYPTLDGAGA
jgi:hypothetical protein